MKKIAAKTLEMVLEYGVYDTRKYRYRARYHTIFIKDEEGNYHAHHLVRVQRIPMDYIGTTAMLDLDAWEIVVDIDTDL